MSETMQGSPDEQIQASAPDRQTSLAPGDDARVVEPVSSNAEPRGHEITSNNWRPTRYFPADPSGLSRPQLEDHYRAMRCSHKFLVRSRAQLQRRSRESKGKCQDLLDTIHRYEEQFSAIGRERVEQFQLARELQEKLKAFERDQQDLDQLLSQVEEVHGEGGFWSFLKVTELLRRMRELFLSSGVRQ